MAELDTGKPSSTEQSKAYQEHIREEYEALKERALQQIPEARGRATKKLKLKPRPELPPLSEEGLTEAKPEGQSE